MWSVTCKNDNSACLYFLIVSPDSYFHFISGLYHSNNLKYFNDTLKDYRTSQREVSHARMKTLLFFVISHDPYFYRTFTKLRRAYAIPPVYVRMRTRMRVIIMFSFCP